MALYIIGGVKGFAYVKISKLLIYPEGAWNLTDALATLKWEIWEYVGIVSRNSIPNNFHEDFAKDILAQAGGLYTMKMLEDERYHDKGSPNYQTVFAFMKTLPRKKETAFLFRKH